MASLKQKNKLVSLLKRLDGNHNPDASLVNDIIAELEQIRSSIPQAPDLSPYFNDVQSLKNEYLILSKAINGLSQAITESTDATDDKFLEISEDISKAIEEIKNDLENLREIEMRQLSTGGGSAHRKLLNNGTEIATRYADLNFIGSGVTISTSNDNTKKVTNITLSVAGQSPQTPTGTVNGVNATFVFATAPNLVCVDQGRFMQKTSSDGTTNWTGTTTVVLTVPPNFDIFGL